MMLLTINTQETEKQLEFINKTLLIPPKNMVFDVDSSDFVTYGNQEQSEYSGHYNPLVIILLLFMMRGQVYPASTWESL